MEHGHFSRHLNRMRKLYKKKLEHLTADLQEFAPAVKISGEQAGMHIVLTVQTPLTETELVELAKRSKIRVFGLSSYDVRATTAVPPQIVLGFGGLSETEITEGIAKLMECWKIA